MRMIQRFLAVAIVLFAALFPHPLLAVGESPNNPISWTPGSSPLTIQISRGGTVVWVRAGFGTPRQESHVVFETTGNLDPVLHLYKNLTDARADKEMASDDDSGAGFNARIRQSLGYPSPYYLKVHLFSSNATGTFQLTGTRSFAAPEDCPSTGPCALVAVTRDEPRAREILSVLRNVRTDLLQRTPSGQRIEELYWALSRDILWAVASDSTFRRELYTAVTELYPLLQELARAGLGQGTGQVLSSADVEVATRLRDLLLPHLSAETASTLNALFDTFGLPELAGVPVADALAGQGLLPEQPSPWVLAPDGHAARPGEILLRLREPLPDRALVAGRRLASGHPRLDALLAGLPVEAARPLFALRAGAAPALAGAYLLRLGDDGEVDALIRALRQEPDVVWAERNGRMQMLSDDIYYSYQWALENRQNPLADIGAPEAWTLTRGRSSVLVAVVDTGIDYTFADFASRVRTDIDYDFHNDDADSFDDQGHGTHVSGIIGAAINNSYSVAGVAPEVSLVGFKVLGNDGTGSWSSVAEGIAEAVRVGARVINLSLGADQSSQAVEDALRHAHQQGVLVAAAAGNDGTNGLIFPASSQYTVAVGATDSANQLASFSNYGQGLDLVAPGVGVVSLFQQGQSCNASGTSMATPHVSGVGALVLSRESAIPLSMLKQRLFDGAYDLGSRGYDTRFGWGRVDAAGSLGLTGPPPTSSCQPGPTTLCLHENRFSIELSWRRPDGQTGRGQAVPFTQRAGLFYFSNPDNLEMLIKILDGCPINNRFWVFYAATTNVELVLRVTDHRSGQVREYRNALNHTADPVQDVQAFATCP